MENSEEDDEGSYTSSNDTINELLETQDIIISDLRDEVEVLKARVDNLKAVIVANLPLHLTEIISNL
jgi:hypothetical protein